MKNCPQCGKPVDGLECGFCLYRERNSSADDHDPALWVEIEHQRADGSIYARTWVRRCANTERGLRCSRPGTLSTSSKAEFCAQHFAPFAGRTYGMPLLAPPPERFQAMRDIVRRSQIGDPEGRAEREAIQADSDVDARNREHEAIARDRYRASLADR